MRKEDNSEAKKMRKEDNSEAKKVKIENYEKEGKKNLGQRR